MQLMWTCDSARCAVDSEHVKTTLYRMLAPERRAFHFAQSQFITTSATLIITVIHTRCASPFLSAAHASELYTTMHHKCTEAHG